MKALFSFICLIFFIPTSSATYKLVWSDEFDSDKLNTSIWNIDSGDKWYNNELQAYTPSNIHLEGGVLRIEAKKETFLSKKYTSGRINTRKKKFFNLGRFEARMKFPTGKGFWPAFWMFPDNWDAQNYREIDILEAIGSFPQTVYSTCWGGPESQLKSVKGKLDFKETYDKDYHVYFADWKRGSIDFGVDGKVVMTCSKQNLAQYSYDNPNDNYYLILNLAVGGNWPGSPGTGTVFPSSMYVDWVRVYQDDGIDGEGKCTKGKNVLVIPISNDGGVNPRGREREEEREREDWDWDRERERDRDRDRDHEPPVISGKVHCSDYQERSYYEIWYLKELGKVDSLLIGKEFVEDREECCERCGKIADCIGLQYYKRRCLLYSLD